MKAANTSFQIRLKAFLLDGLFSIVFCIFNIFIVVIILGTLSNLFKLDYEIYDRIPFLERIICYLTLGAYFIFKDLFTKNGSFGNKIMKIKVVNSQSLERPNNKKLVLKGMISFFTSFVDIAFCKYRLDNRSLSDVVSKTRVIEDAGKTWDDEVTLE